MVAKIRAVVSRQTRILRLLACLQRGPGLNARELSMALDVSRRTVFRDIRLLRDAGLDIHYDADSAAYRMSSVPHRNLTPRVFELQDLMHLTLAAQSSLFNGIEPFASAVREAVARLLANYSGDVGDSLSRLLNACSVHVPSQEIREIDSQLLYKVFDAIRQRRRVRLTFLVTDEGGEKEGSGEDAVRATQFSPYRLIVAPRQWLVEGRSSYHRRRHVFALSEIQTIQVTRNEFTLPCGNRTHRAPKEMSPA